MQAGRAVAFMMDDAILYGERAKSKNADDWVVVGTAYKSLEAYGCMMRKGDEPFKKLVDSTIADLMKSGEINKIHNKWFEQPIPPRGLHAAFRAVRAVKRCTQILTTRPPSNRHVKHGLRLAPLGFSSACQWQRHLS